VGKAGTGWDMMIGGCRGEAGRGYGFDPKSEEA
jgi:hypothetical protein